MSQIWNDEAWEGIMGISIIPPLIVTLINIVLWGVLIFFLVKYYKRKKNKA